MTYEKYAKEHDINCMMLKTRYGLVDPIQLENYHDAVLLINSMPAYSFSEDMNSIEIHAKENNIFIVNDASGSIGTPNAKIGDVIIGSFGKWKPINVGEGGFIATDNEKLYSELSGKIAYTPTSSFLKELETKLKNLNKRLDFLKEKRQDLLKDLENENFDVIFPDSEGLNIIVRFGDDKEKKRIISFCETNNVEYTECPRYIRVNDNAISIEIKRLDN